MEDKFKKIISELKRGRLTAAEKTRLKFKILSSLERETDKARPAVSPYFFRIPAYYFHFSWKTFSKVGVVSALSLFLALGGLTYASSNSLPGDPLYPIKINLKEKIEERLAFTPREKIALRQKRIEDRFAEVEKLIKEKRITPETRSIAESEIQVEKEKIGSDIEAINESNPAAAAQAKAKLDDSINSRQEKIDTQIDEDQDIESIENNLSDFQTELSGYSIEENPSDDDISSTPAPTLDQPAPAGTAQ